MPVLGSGGRVLLKRPTPQPCELTYEEFRPECDSFTFNCPGWWNGDLVCVDKLPIIIDGYPVFVEGYASYQESKYFVGPNRSHIQNDSDAFYKTNQRNATQLDNAKTTPTSTARTALVTYQA